MTNVSEPTRGIISIVAIFMIGSNEAINIHTGIQDRLVYVDRNLNDFKGSENPGIISICELPLSGRIINSLCPSSIVYDLRTFRYFGPK